MELEFEEDGSKIPLEFGSETQIGRELGLGFNPSSTDRTISRRHLSLHLVDDPIEKFRVVFEVIGKNPIWVCGGLDACQRIYKNSEKGELRVGDKLSLSLKKPSFWVIKRREGGNEDDEEKRRVLDAVERREKRTLERRKEKQEREKEEICNDDDNEELGTLDVSQINPVKEFGFLLKGHEFDQYSKRMMHDIKNWNWFLEETRESSDDDEPIDEAASSRGKKGRMKKKKKRGTDDEEEEWTGDSEEEKVVVVKRGNTKRPKYSTRSKERKRPGNDASGSRNPALEKDAKVHKDGVEEEDEEDETLGGFIVDDEEEEEEKDEETEEEFEDEEDEDEE